LVQQHIDHAHSAQRLEQSVAIEPSEVIELLEQFDS
jgi:hypothetical protein